MRAENVSVRACVVAGAMFALGALALGCNSESHVVDGSTSSAVEADAGSCADSTGSCADGTGEEASDAGTGTGSTSDGTSDGATDSVGPDLDGGTGGCVDDDGGMHRGMSSQNCGSGGALCAACAAGESCVSGACATATDDAGTATGDGGSGGCVDGDGGVHRGVSPQACGSGGAMCVACAMGEACIRGACAVRTRDAGMPITDGGGLGCVGSDGGVHRGVTTQACGSGGAMCVTCATGQACVRGACM